MEERFQNGDRTIVCQHEMGRKFSIFLDEGFKRAFPELFGATVKVDTSDNQVIVHVPDQIAVRQPKSGFSSS